MGFHVSRQGFRIQLYEDTSCLNLASFPLFLNTEEVDVARSLIVLLVTTCSPGPMEVPI